MTIEASAAVESTAPSSASGADATTNAVSTTSTMMQPPQHKIDPITAVQDSIDSLALSLFEALRGVRDAVAPESLEVPGATNATANNKTTVPKTMVTAFKEIDEDELAEMERANKTNNNTKSSISESIAKEKLLQTLNMEYFVPRAYDLLEPDYDSFLLSYLGGNEYAKELVERYKMLNEVEDAQSKSAETEDSSKQASPEKKIDNDAKKEGGSPSPSKKDIKLGDVGYEFRKKFDSGWYTGKVTEIRPLAGNRWV